MILECPNCDTSYEIPVELPPEGRKVRCANCQHVWVATPPEEPAAEPEPELEEETSAAADAESAAEDASSDEPDLSALDDFSDEEIVFEEAEEEQPAAEAAEEPEPDVEAEVEAAAEPDVDTEAEPEVQAEAEVEAEPEVEAVADSSDDTDLEAAFSGVVAKTDGEETAQDTDAVDPDEPDIAASAETDIEPEPENQPIVIGKAKRKGLSLPLPLVAGWAGLAVILSGVLATAYFQRVTIVKLLPGTAHAYEQVGLPVNIRGLEFKDVKYSWESGGGLQVLEVFGNIENVSDKPLKVPTVVFGLRTKEKVEVYQWAADVRAELLEPGKTAAFTAQIPSPPRSIRDVQVRFAKVR